MSTADSTRPDPSDSRPPAALLVLEDGRTFTGRAFGAVGETFGEAVFATGMSGYQETLTDPSYHRQVVVATAPHIGNTGWNDEDDESGQIWVAGYVVRDAARVPSSWRSRRSLEDELRAQGVVGVRTSTPAPSPGTCASGAPCASASPASRPTRRPCSRRVQAGTRDGGRPPRRRGHHARALRRPRRGRATAPRRRRRPRHQDHDPAADGPSGGSRCTSCPPPRPSSRSRPWSRTASSSPTAPATRRPPRARSSC